MAAPRPPKGRKPFTDNASPVQGSRGGRGSAWRTSGGSSYGNAARQGNQFPPLSASPQRPETGYDPKLLSTLATVINQVVVISLKSGARHEGTVVNTISEGDAAGVTLKDSRDLANPAAAVRESFVLPASNIASWTLRVTNGTDGFRTDTDISNATGPPAGRERELQQWQPDAAPPTNTAASLAALQGDEATFGPAGGYSGVPWDQFEVNEQLFGVTTKFDEDAYTTKLNRDAPGFKERERKAQQIANEIISGTTSNPHIAEERAMNGTENGIGEEDKYSAVVRAPGAYVPPGARRNGSGPSPAQANGPSAAAPTPAVATPQAPATNGTSATVPIITTPSTEDAAAKPPAEGLVANFRDFVTNEKQRLAQRKQAMVKTEMDKRKADLLKFSKNFKLTRPIPEDLVPILAKDEEKQKAIREKSIAEVLATQQRAAAGPSGASVTPTTSKAPNSSDSTVKPVAKPTTVAAPDGAAKKVKTSMFIQAIPPFSKVRKAGTPGTGAASTPTADGPATIAQPTPGPSNPTIHATPASPTVAQAASRLNANASVFKPNANAAPFKPTSPAATPAPKPKEPLKESNVQASNIATPPNPFYGTRVPTKKGVSVHLKEDFNPFRHSKVVDASQVSSIWPYNGKRFAASHPTIPTIHAAPNPTVPNPFIPGPPPQQHEEDPNAQGGPGQRQPPQQQQQAPPLQPPQPQPGYPMMYYPQYPYSPAPHGQQPMMMPPASPFMAPGYHMQPMPYPPHMQPNGMGNSPQFRGYTTDRQAAPPMYGHPPPGMQGVPPTPHYMQHPPYGQTSPPPTGTPRGPGMPPPQQMPPHGYYHPSPQMTHAMPYQMMMPPQPQPGAHFDPSQQGPQPVPPQPTPMGQH